MRTMRAARLGTVSCALWFAGFNACKAQNEDHTVTASRDAGPGLSAPADGKVVLTEAPPDGDVPSIVKNASEHAARAHRKLVVYVGATWCEPCRRFHAAAEQGELDAMMPDLTLLEFDLDRDGERLAAAGYTSKYIPLFAVPGPDGTASGKQIEGAVKGEQAVGFIAPRLKALLGTYR